MDLLATTQALNKAAHGADISQILSAFGSPKGLGTHVISPVPTPARPVEDAWFLVQNWPEAWHEAYVSEGFAEFDPIPRAATLISRPITIAEIRAGGAGFVPDPRAERLFSLAEEMGRGHGLLIPIFGPQGYRGIVCFAGPGPALAEEDRAAFHLVGLYAHDRIRALTLAAHRAETPLSDREVAVLSCASRGLGDAQTAEHLNVTVRTVRFHFTNIRRKLGADTREQCIAIAAHQGML